MKRVAPFFFICLCALSPLAFGQGDLSSEAAAIARQQKNEEEFRRINSIVESLLEAQTALQQRIASLSDDVKSLRSEMNRSQSNFVTREDLNRVIESVQEKLREIDKKREADKKLILEALDDIRKLAKAPAAQPPTIQSTANLERGYVYEVKTGNTLSDIINAYNEIYKEDGKGKITLEDVKRLNPDLNPDRIQPGQKIEIPKPPST